MSSNVLLYNKKSFRSAKALATVLGLKPLNDKHADRLTTAPVVRYGSSCNSFTTDTQFNCPEVIKLCADSVLFSKWAQEHDILSPIYTHFNMSTDNHVYPYLLRKRWHHGGKDIIVITAEEDLQDIPLDEHFYKVPYFRTAYELRVHVINNEVVRLFKKLSDDDDAHAFIRTAYRGWRYSLRSQLDDYFHKAQSIAVETTKLLNIGFAAFDIAWCPDHGQYIVWEVNTAPGLNINTLQVYGKALRGLING